MHCDDIACSPQRPHDTQSWFAFFSISSVIDHAYCERTGSQCSLQRAGRGAQCHPSLAALFSHILTHTHRPHNISIPVPPSRRVRMEAESSNCRGGHKCTYKPQCLLRPYKRLYILFWVNRRVSVTCSLQGGNSGRYSSPCGQLFFSYTHGTDVITQWWTHFQSHCAFEEVLKSASCCDRVEGSIHIPTINMQNPVSG